MARKVILVGGMFGSYLVFDAGPQRNKDVWYDRTHLALKGPDALHLAPDGINPGTLTDGTPLGWGGLLQTYGGYKGMADRLHADGWTVYPFSCDWRRDLQANAVQLADEFQFFAGDDDCWVIGYSMGGLLARLAYPIYKSRVLTDRWKRTVYVATPHYGSHAAAIGLARPQDTTPLPGVLLANIAAAFKPLTSARNKPALVTRLYQTVASWPSIYQLLPSITPEWTQTRPKDDLLYSEGAYDNDNYFTSEEWMTRAQVVRGLIDDTLDGPRAPEVNVVGNGCLTADALNAVTKIGKLEGYKQLYFGDGVVTVERATLPGVNNFSIPLSEHSAILGDGRLLTRITDLLLNGLGAPAETPRPVQTVQEETTIKEPVVPEAKPWSAYPKVNDP